ncbi:type VI secretion system tip protein VgrG [Thalassotalea atypica]|uniref:type VI secretion system tip protein VgrG n=1 Tax=Thalassotalea atypica TaxID=2054316 RepID=UPI00257407DE|nr:type VI secretion system tip protein VgrG [Thalassotalea atypica]
MADSPALNSSGVIKCTIFSEGNSLNQNYRLISIVIEKRINKIARAELVFSDGDMPNKKFPLSDAEEVSPGKKITIKVGYGNSEDQIFEGIVIRHGLHIDESTSILKIHCFDEALAMTVGRKNANFIDLKNSDIISQILNQYNQITNEVTESTTKFAELVQYNASDWDFMVARAESSGLLVAVEDGKVSVFNPKTQGDALLTVTYGEDLIEFEADINAQQLYKEVKSIGWNLDNLATQEEAISSLALNKQGNLTESTLAEILKLDSYRLQTTVPLEQSALKEWATGQQQKSSLSKICGRMTFQGSAKAKLAGVIEIKGVGKRFSGNVFISGVRHEVVNGNWITEVQFGLDAKFYTDENNVHSSKAAGLTPGVEGLMTGIVEQLDEDPQGQNRIKVVVPVLQAETQGVWARLVQYYGSSGFGNFFIPEIGDEVVLGYFNNDPSNPVVLGSLYSSKHTPPYDLTADNFIKALVTRSGHKVEFDDDKKIITIVTPSENSIVLSDDDKSITLADQNSNTVTLNTSGIALDSPKDISIKAKGTINIDAVGKISVSSKADIAQSGLNISNTANVGFTAKGNATAELSASGQTTVKGAIVMIN